MPDASHPFPALAGRLVLVVEDEYLLAEDLREAVEAQGGRVLGPAPSVAGAVVLLSGETPDAAILDINLGGEMAFPVADALRARGVPFVFLTGYEPWAVPPAYAGVACCEKPADMKRVIAALIG